MSVFQLFYVSNAILNFDPKEIYHILQTAHQFNPTQQLTGVMMFRGGTFLQLLEGPEDNVRALYAKISKDPRHKNLMVLMERHTDSRLFEDWSMAYHEIGPFDLSLISEIIEWKSLVTGANVDNIQILRFLNLFQNKKLQNKL